MKSMWIWSALLLSCLALPAADFDVRAVTRLALTLDEPAKAVKVTMVFRPE